MYHEPHTPFRNLIAQCEFYWFGICANNVEPFIVWQWTNLITVCMNSSFEHSSNVKLRYSIKCKMQIVNDDKIAADYEVCVRIVFSTKSERWFLAWMWVGEISASTKAIGMFRIREFLRFWAIVTIAIIAAISERVMSHPHSMRIDQSKFPIQRISNEPSNIDSVLINLHNLLAIFFLSRSLYFIGKFINYKLRFESIGAFRPIIKFHCR